MCWGQNHYENFSEYTATSQYNQNVRVWTRIMVSVKCWIIMIPSENDTASGRDYLFNSIPEQLVHMSKSQGYLQVLTVFSFMSLAWGWAPVTASFGLISLGKIGLLAFPFLRQVTKLNQKPKFEAKRVERKLNYTKKPQQTKNTFITIMWIPITNVIELSWILHCVVAF